MYSIFASLYHTGFLDIYRLQLASEVCLLLVPLTEIVEKIQELKAEACPASA
jgi:hypothetical protein